MIFSHVLYQLSYPGIAAATVVLPTGERWKRAYGEAGRALQAPESQLARDYPSSATSSGHAGGPGSA